MTVFFPEILLLSVVLCLVQGLLALPWLYAVDPGLVRSRFSSAGAIAATLGGFAAVCVGVAFFIESNMDRDLLAGTGRIYGFLLQIQLSANLFVAVFFVLLRFWSKGGAVTLAAFREGIRQPMFWILTSFGIGLLLISPVLPYFTFGEDLKMLKDLGYITIMFTGAVFGILAASMSISEEIEGRAAVTVISKPISRRNFLLGKFGGILLAAGLMNLLLSWLLVWVIQFYEWWNPAVRGVEQPDAVWITEALRQVFTVPGPTMFFSRGMLLWCEVSGAALPGFIITFCQVMVLVAIAVALATRVPMIVNLLLCLAIYFLGHLTPILTAVAEKRSALIAFMSRVFNYVLPGLDNFDMGPAVVRYAPLPLFDFGVYTLHVALYAVIYTTIALLFGLILFEDRDLA